MSAKDEHEEERPAGAQPDGPQFKFAGSVADRLPEITTQRGSRLQRARRLGGDVVRSLGRQTPAFMPPGDSNIKDQGLIRRFYTAYRAPTDQIQVT